MELYVGLYGGECPGLSAPEAAACAGRELGTPAAQLRLYRLRPLQSGALLGPLGPGEAFCALAPSRSGSLTMGLFTLVSQQSRALRQLQGRAPRGPADVREALRIAGELLATAEEAERARAAAARALEGIQARLAAGAAGARAPLPPGRETREARETAEAAAQLRAAALGAALRREGERAAGRAALASRLRAMRAELGME